MMVEQNPGALVVGAGPVGMMTALLLAEQGIRPVIIDGAGGTAAHSYACALHPHTLEMLDGLGLISEILEWGYCLRKVGFYEGPFCRTEIDLTKLDAKYPFVVTLPQNALELLLERALKRRAKIAVQWRYHLTRLEADVRRALCLVNEVGGDPLRNGSAHFEELVKEPDRIQTPLLIGADGYHSTVRQCLGIHCTGIGEPEVFCIFEFETDADLENEVRVVLDQSTTNVLWPISSRRCRWSFQVLGTEAEAGFPKKSRLPFQPCNPEWEAQAREFLGRLIQERAPWFKGTVHNLNCVQRVNFGRKMAERFNSGPCWLVGDAAHQTSPVGMQSMNVGFREAEELAKDANHILKGTVSHVECANAWQERWQREWSSLLGGLGSWRISNDVGGWLSRCAKRIPSCLPASGQHLANLLSQLGIAES